MITLTTPTDLKVLAVLVPRDAHNVSLNLKENLATMQSYIGYNSLIDPTGFWVRGVTLYGDLLILGTLHMDNGLPVFSEGFDARAFVPKKWARVTYKDTPVWIELIHPEGFMVLDPTFGESTGWGRREFLEKNGSDMRFSISLKEWTYSWLTVELPRQADRYLVNPMGEEPNTNKYWRTVHLEFGEVDHFADTYAFGKAMEAWRAAEEKGIKEKIVFVLVKE